MQDGQASGHHRQGQRRAASPHLLTGRIRKARGRTMTPTHAQKGKLRFRSYVASSAAPVTSDVPVSALRIPAPRIEAVVVGTWRGLIPPEDHPSGDAALVADHLDHVIVHPDRLVLTLTNERQPHVVAWSHRVRRAILVPPGRVGERLLPMKREDQPKKLRILWSLDPADQSIAAAQLAASSETEIAGLETQARIGVGHPIKRRERG